MSRVLSFKNLKKKLKKITRGQTLIEVLIATVVVAGVLTAIAATLSQSVKNTAESKQKTLAIRLGQEGLELYRREKNLLGWQSFYDSANSGNYCLASLPATSTDFAAIAASNCGTEEYITDTQFVRQATVIKAADEVSVLIEVAWKDGNVDRKVEVSQEFREFE